MKASGAKYTRLRMGVVMAVFAAAFGVIMWRALHLQVLDRERLADIAEREAYKVVKVNPVRGKIYDRNGEKLAVSLDTDSLFAQPSKVKNPKKLAESLAPILNVDEKRLAGKLSGDGSFQWIKRQISPEVVEAVQDLDAESLGFVKESKRFYPNNVLASHILGFVGVDAQGLEGLELSMDERLKGGVNEYRVKRDALGRTFLDRDATMPRPDQGCDVHLTIDRRVQYITEAALLKAVSKHQAKGGMAVVVRPATGEILAAATLPNYNPNCFNRFQAAARRNRVVTDAFDPGSTFKIFVVAAALEENLVQPDEAIYCEKGDFRIGGRTIHDHHPYGDLTVAQVIQKSSNIGTVKISNRLGAKGMYDYLRRFTFGGKTGVDFPGESRGLLRPYRKWRKIDMANVAFGQGISVTAMQMVMAMSAIANDGWLMKPLLVSKVTDESGRVVERYKPKRVRQVISRETAEAVQEMLRMVVEKGGTGTRAEAPGYPAAGKTGTAQKLDRKAGRYYEDRFFSSFLGYVPHDQPELCIFAALDEPRPNYYGGLVAAPIFREIAQKALPLLNVPPVLEEGGVRLVSTEKEAAFEAEKKAEVKARPSNSLTRRVNPKTVKAVSDLALAIREAEGVDNKITRKISLAKTAAKPLDVGVMPNLEGLSMRRVLEVMSHYRVPCSFTGSGLAVWQTPPPGQTLRSGTVCQVRFEQW